MTFRKVSGLVCIWQCPRAAPRWARGQTDIVRACRSMPQENGSGVVYNRLRAPPAWEPGCFHYQHTTEVGGGGGLNKYHRRPGDAFQRPLRFRFRAVPDAGLGPLEHQLSNHNNISNDLAKIHCAIVRNNRLALALMAMVLVV